jgi:hypothetical protein
MRRAILIGIFLLGTVGIGACQDQGKGSADSSKKSGSGEKGNEEPGPVRTACKDDVEKFCAGEQRAGRCLREHDSADLSPACSTALANRGSNPR